MEQNTPQQIPNTQGSITQSNTFSAEVARENTVSTNAFENNQGVLAAHRRGLVFRGMWVLLVLLLLASLAFAVFITIRSRGSLGKTFTAADNYNSTNLNIASVATTPLNGQVTINGSQLNNGNLTVLGTTNISGDINVGGTVNASNLSGSLDATNIVGIIQPAQLDPFIAYVNKDNQAFFGTNQIFRNASNTTAGFQVQNASAAPILTINTQSNYLVVNEAAASQTNLAFETNGNGRFAGSLQVGLQSNPNTSILHTGSLFNNDIQRVLTVQEEISNNNVAGRIYTGLSNELLVNPQFNPDLVSAGGQNNVFAGSYSAIEIAQGNNFNFGIVGGNLNAITHSGGGLLNVGVANFSTITNRGPGNILYAVGNLAAPALTGPGNIGLYSGFDALDPQSPIFSLLGTPNLITGTGSIFQQVGVLIDPQHSGTTNYNLASIGLTQNNAIEGSLQIGFCSNVLTSNALYNCGNPIAQGVAPFSPANPVPGGTKLQVNQPLSANANAVVQISSTLATDKPLVVQGTAAQAGNLTEWQSNAGTGLSVVSANGSFGIGTNAPGAFMLNVSDTTTTNVAQFNGSAATQCTVITGTGWSCSSDENLKTNILSVNNGLDVISQLRGVTFNWKADANGTQQDGFIAQEVQRVLPQLVTTDANGNLSLNKDGILPYLVNAMQQQQTQITALQNSTQVANGVFSGGIVSGDVEFNGKATFNALTTYNSDVVFTQGTTFDGSITGSSNNRGKTSITAGATSIAITPTGTHSSVPNVQLTPLNQIDGAYWVTTTNSGGFIVHLEKAQASTVQFNWLVID